MKHRNANRCLPLCLVLVINLAALGQGSPLPEKKLIAWGGTDNYTAEDVQMNIRKIEELPFDGMIIQGFKTTKQKDGQVVMLDWESFGKLQWQRDELAPAINVLKNIDWQRFTDNFLRFNVSTSPGMDVDWFDNFDAPIHNAALWAQVAKDAGYKGWAFDVEDYYPTGSYGERIFYYPELKYKDTKTFAEYQAQVRLRGYQVMQAIQAEYPDITLLLMVAHSYAYRDIEAKKPLPEISYGLLPAFLNGLIDAAGPQVKFIDGQEQAYGYLTSEDYYRGYHVTRQEALVLVPPELRTKYQTQMDVGVAIYSNYVLGLTDWPGHYPTHYFTLEERLRIFEQNVYYALKTSDQYVWLYSEHLSWWRPGWTYPVPEGALAAIRSARQKVRNSQPLGFEISARRVHTAQATLKMTNPSPPRDSFLLSPLTDKPAPNIDGVLDDAVWKQLPPLPAFFRMSLEPDQASSATMAQAAFDGENLYIAFRCEKQEPAQLRSVPTNKDDILWSGDCVEVSLKTGENSLPFHFIVNPQNVQWDGKGDFADWNAQWHSGTHLGAKEWTVEIAIPWDQIGGRPASRSLRAFLCRRGPGGGELDAAVQVFSLPAESTAR